MENYLGLFESLNSIGKLELIEKLTKSLKTETKIKVNNFYKSFGAFSTEKTSDEIIVEIKLINNEETFEKGFEIIKQRRDEFKEKWEDNYHDF